MSQVISDQEYKSVIRNFRIAAGLSLMVVVIGAVFYHLVEDWGWLDSIYFSVVTLATVGYGDLAPATTAGKIFTIFYILTGIGIIATFANLLIKRAFAKRQHKNLPKR